MPSLSLRHGPLQGGGDTLTQEEEPVQLSSSSSSLKQEQERTGTPRSWLEEIAVCATPLSLSKKKPSTSTKKRSSENWIIIGKEKQNTDKKQAKTRNVPSMISKLGVAAQES